MMYAYIYILKFNSYMMIKNKTQKYMNSIVITTT